MMLRGKYGRGELGIVWIKHTRRWQTESPESALRSRRRIDGLLAALVGRCLFTTTTIGPRREY